MTKRKASPPPDITTLLYGVGLLVLVTALLIVGWLFFQRSGGEKKTGIVPAEAGGEEVVTCPFHRWLDGVCVPDEAAEGEPLLAVMIENHVDARPPAGLAAARVVYEAPVEANITRFMALYPVSAEIVKVGPVRSARPYYLDWLAEYPGIMYMHVGGSPDALNRIIKDGVFDLNEFYHGWYYWRATDRSAPHNVYTRSKLWQKAWEEGGGGMDPYASWHFAERTPCEGDTCIEKVTVSFAPPSYKPVWTYDAETGLYTRSQSGSTHRDGDGTAITAGTVIVQKVTTRVLDSIGRISLGAVGEGDVYVFRDGHMTEGTWKKISPTDRTRFFDEQNSEIPLKPGVIWIEAVGQDGSVVYE